jgi:hypothetical protein
VIRIVPVNPPWEESSAFTAAIHEKVAEKVRERLRREVTGAADIFKPDPDDDGHEPLTVTNDAQGIEITAEAATEAQAAVLASQIKRVVREEVGDLPIEEIRKAVNRDDPATTR